MNDNLFINKKHIPIAVLIIVSCSWAYFYNSNNFMNDYGQSKHEWLFLFDAFIVLPILCWTCIEDKQNAIIKALLYMCLAVLIGSFIIPEENKLIMPYLENGRFVILALFLLFEISVIATVYWAIQAGFKKGIDPDKAIQEPVEKWLGEGLIAQIMCFEARMWSFLLFNKRIKKDNYAGDTHFSYHNKDGAHSNALGLIWLIVIEIPLVHLLLHFIWSPFAANVITGLTLFGLCFMIAGYRAMSRRPISILNNQLVVRMGLLNSYSIKMSDISLIESHDSYVSRSKVIKRFNFSNNPNIKISLNSNHKKLEAIYLGVDNPALFIQGISSRLNNLS